MALRTASTSEHRWFNLDTNERVTEEELYAYCKSTPGGIWLQTGTDPVLRGYTTRPATTQNLIDLNAAE